MIGQFRKTPATFGLIIINVGVFLLSWILIGSFDEPEWSRGLLSLGALYNPLTLDDQWYRILSHMFLHGHIPHLIVNMFGLFSVGTQLEAAVGTTKFLWVYFLSGILSALTTLYFNLFSVGVGASGAIFGLFGFALVVQIFLSRRDDRPLSPIFLNFAIFLGINLVLAEVVNADNAAHFGGLACGIIIGAYSLISDHSFAKVRSEYALLIACVIIFIMLPRFQVRYFKFFNGIISLERQLNNKTAGSHSDEQYLALFRSTTSAWDSTRQILEDFPSIPEKLHADTSRLIRYITLRKKASVFRTMMIERESYVYLDSVQIANDSTQKLFPLDYNLYLGDGDEEKPEPEESIQPQLTKVWYDKDWIEIDRPGMYYRIGSRDSPGRWQGPVQDFYANGVIQMKGSYKDDKREGVFLYYSDHNTYTSAGRYAEDLSIGKWETYHNNGMLESEVFYTNGYFLKNLWDSTGTQLVVNGEGRVMRKFPNGVIAEEGEYKSGNKHGYWYGRHEDGSMYFEENYRSGMLINGRSRTLGNQEFVYDGSSLFPIPVGGQFHLNAWLSETANKINTVYSGTVKVSFRVTAEGKLTDFQFEPLPPREDAEKIESHILNGPAWLPAREHGHKPVDGFALVTVKL